MLKSYLLSLIGLKRLKNIRKFYSELDNLSKTFSALKLFKSVTCIALKFSLSILTLCAVVCLPNKVNPFAPTCAAICAGPVSFAITKELSFINEVNCEISKAFSLSRTGIAL